MNRWHPEDLRALIAAIYDASPNAITQPKMAVGKAEHLLAELAKAMTQWIKCSERLPDKAGEYLVVHQTRYCNAPWANVVVAANYRYGDWFCYQTNYTLCDFVTHWMPLPAPPAEEVKP